MKDTSQHKNKKAPNLGQVAVQGTVCSFCDKVYIFPCNGERYDCANAVWVRSKGTVDYYRVSEEDRAKINKGKMISLDNVRPKGAPLSGKTKSVTEVVQAVAELADAVPSRKSGRIDKKVNKKRKRVRL